MPARSVAQQRFFGVIRAVQKGEMKHPSARVRAAAKSISPTQARHFAATRHGRLPKHVKQHVIARVKRACDRAMQEKYASVASDVLTLLSVYHPVFKQAGEQMRQSYDLHQALHAALPFLTRTSHDQLFTLITAATDKAANADTFGVGGPGSGIGTTMDATGIGNAPGLMTPAPSNNLSFAAAPTKVMAAKRMK